MKLTKILMSGAAVLTPAVVLPLVNAAKVEKSTVSTTNKTTKAASNEIITVGTDGWVNVDEKGLVKYHLSFDETNKICTMDRMTVTSSASDKITLKPQAEYKTELFPQSGTFRLTAIKVHGGCSGSGELECLDFCDARYVEVIGAQCFDTGNDGGCGFKIRHVSFTGASSLTTIEKLAFWNQYFERDSEDQDLDFSSTSLETIGEDAFRACCRSGAKYQFERSIIFPASLKSIGSCAFETYKGQNSFTPRKVVFLGTTAPTLGDGGSLPSVADSVSGQTCVIVPAGCKQTYWNAWSPAHSPRHYELGQPIKESNLIESDIKFDDFEQPGAGTANLGTQLGRSGTDSSPWYPITTDGQKTEVLDNTDLWLTNDINGKLHLTNTGGKYTLSWDSDIPAGQYTYRVMASHNDGQNMTVTCSQYCTFTVNEVTLTGGSSIIRASNYEGEDTKTWTTTLSYSTIESVTWSIVGDESITKYVKANGSQNTATVSWLENSIPAGTYSLKLKANIVDNLQFKYDVTAPITLVIQSTYYAIEVDNTAIELELGTTNASTATITVKMNEGGQYVDGDMTTPKLSIADRKGIAFTKTTGTVGIYTITITADATNGLAAGSYEFYVYSTAKVKVAGQEINYPIYSNDIKINVKNNGQSTAKECTGGSGDLVSYNGTAGQDTQSWAIDTGATISGLTITPAKWTSFDPQRMTHIKATKDANKFTISWDEIFTKMASWWEIVDFNVEFDGTFDSASENSVTQHFVVPITMSIRNAGETKSTAGSNIYGYPETAVELSTEPWQMYSNGSDIPVSTQVDFWIEDSELPDKAQGKIWMRTDAENPSQAYLNYSNLEEGTYSFNIYGYDYENVVYTTQAITLRIANVATIYGTPSSLSINRGNGKYSKPLSVKVNGEDWIGSVEYTVYNIDEEAFNVDSNGYIYWTNKLEAGIYNPTIYATVTLLDGTTITSVPVQVSLTVNPAVATKSNVGAIVGGTVGGTVGAGGAATGGYFGIKKYKAVKGKKKTA